MGGHPLSVLAGVPTILFVDYHTITCHEIIGGLKREGKGWLFLCLGEGEGVGLELLRGVLFSVYS